MPITETNQTENALNQETNQPDPIFVILPDGTRKDMPAHSTGLDLVHSLHSQLAKTAICLEVCLEVGLADGVNASTHNKQSIIQDLSRLLVRGSHVKIHILDLHLLDNHLQ
jgi:hypothetical protein